MAHGPRTKMFTSTVGAEQPWTLAVQHGMGSIDAAAASSLRRNLAVGFGLLLLLGGCGGGDNYFGNAGETVRPATDRFCLVGFARISHAACSHLFGGENLADGVAKRESQVSSYGELIKGEGRKLSGMVEQILDFAGADSGRKKYRFPTPSVADVMNDAVTECRQLMTKAGRSGMNVLRALPAITATRRAVASRPEPDRELDQVQQRQLLAAAVSGERRRQCPHNGRGPRYRYFKSDQKQIFEPFYRSRAGCRRTDTRQRPRS